MRKPPFDEGFSCIFFDYSDSRIFMERIIPVTYGTGAGSTPLAAFDAALFDAGIANHNLIHLSSVIPSGIVPVVKKVDLNYAGSFGDKAYVVIAERREVRKGHEAWAGLGWVVAEEQPPRGLFVEHWGENEEEVISSIKKSLGSMVRYRRETYGPVQYKTMGIACEGEPVCAVVVAIYEAEGWRQLAKSFN